MGVLELKIIECGHTSLDYELALSGHPQRLATAAEPVRTTRVLRHPIYSYLIEHTLGRVLVDTAVSVSYQQEWRDRFYQNAMAYDPGPDGLFTQRLEQLGLATSDIDHVVITHLHTDHAGNVRLFDPARTRIYVGQDELRSCARVKGGLLRDDLLTVWGVTSPQGFTRADFAGLLPDRAVEVYADFELLPGVWLVTLPGHTWGTLGVAVKLEESGWMLIASDTIYLADSWGERFVPSLLHHNLEQWAHSAQKVRRLVERYGMKILPGHDAQVIEPAGDGGYRVVPIEPRYR
jgi:N-acyl homoserine lactone hydrolase